MNALTVVHDVSLATKPDSSAICTNVHVKANLKDALNKSVNATSATNVCINSCDLKANVQISSKTKHVYMQFKVDTDMDTNLLPLDLYHKLHPNAMAISLQKDPGVHQFAYNGSKIKYFGICPFQVCFKNNCSVVNFYVVGKGKLILGLVSSRKCGHIFMHSTIEKSENFHRAQPANHAKAQTTHPLLSRSDSWLPKQNMHWPDMTTVPPINSKADSKTGKSTDNFVGSPEQIQHDKQALKKCKGHAIKYFNSVFDTSTVGNLPCKVHL